MTNIDLAWGVGPSAGYEALAERFRPIFARIGATAVEREQKRILPRDEIGWLKESGLTALRLPKSVGGSEATLPELFALMIELGEADPNIPNALRSHFGFGEDHLNADPTPWRDSWLARLGKGETIGSGVSEVGENKLGSFSTRLVRQNGHYLLNGEKYYTTGSLFADWINLSAGDENGKPVGALVPTNAPGVEILDDWDGFGQTLSASGTARFTDVVISSDLVKPAPGRFPYSSGYFQLFHLATLAGVGRAATADVTRLVSGRRRVYGRGNAASVSQDPQILQVVGRVRSAAYAAAAIVLRAAESLQRSHDAHLAKDDAERVKAAKIAADVEVSQSVTVVTTLILDATTQLFDALGASALKRGPGLDRHWRNARALSSHNPRIYHDRIVGDYAVNGEPPGGIGGVGVSNETSAPAASGSVS